MSCNFQSKSEKSNQRAENVGLDLLWLDLNFGAPRSPQPLFSRFLERFGAKIGAQADPTATDPTPQSRPSKGSWCFCHSPTQRSSMRIPQRCGQLEFSGCRRTSQSKTLREFAFRDQTCPSIGPPTSPPDRLRKRLFIAKNMGA